jgi:hypothetical protein
MQLQQIGPMIGGSFSRPTEQWPQLFGNNAFLKKYPYFLPCAIPATFSLVAWLVTFMFLKETVQHTVPVPQLLKGRKTKVDEDAFSGVPDSEKPFPLRSLLTPKVILAATNYAALSLIDIAYRAIQPTFFSTPIDDGGLGLSPAAIGNILSLLGILNGTFQIFFFAKIHDRFGSRNTFVFGIGSCFFLFALYPFINHLARIEGYSTKLWTLVVIQVMISILPSLSYGPFRTLAFDL